MKKEDIHRLISGLVAVLALSGCGKTGPDNPPSQTAPSQQTPQANQTLSPPPPLTKEIPLIPVVPIREKVRRHTEILECRFARHIEEKKVPKVFHCIAAAQVRLHSESEVEEFDAPTHSRHDHLTVACEGETIYADGATHTSIRENQFLIGNSDFNPMVMLMYPSKRPDSEPCSFASSLRIGEKQLEGSCESEIREETE